MRSRIGRPATRSIGLGMLSVSGRRRSATAAGHDHRPVRARDGLDEGVEQVERDGPAGVVDDRDGIDAPGAHEVERVGAGLCPADRHELAVEDGRQRVVEGDPGEQGPPKITVGGEADEPAVLVDREADSRRAPVDRGQRVAHGGRLGDDRAGEAFGRAALSHVPLGPPARRRRPRRAAARSPRPGPRPRPRLRSRRRPSRPRRPAQS